MNKNKLRIAIVFPADLTELAATRVEDTRFAAIARALREAGGEVISAPWN
jgi:hypothetical protein